MSGGAVSRVGFVVAGLAAASVLGGCIRSDVEVVDHVDPASLDALPSQESASVQTDVGRTVTTSEGNAVTVETVSAREAVEGSQLSRVAVRVEICAADDGDGAPADADFFRAVLGDGGLRRAAEFAESGALEARRIDAGSCASGTVSFPVADGEEVVAIALLASSRVEWRVP